MNLVFDLEAQAQAQAQAQEPSDYELKMPQLTKQEKVLHEKALARAKQFKKSHADLLQIIIDVDKAKLFNKFLLSSTFSYCQQILKLSEDITCTLTKIARVSKVVPELKVAIDEGLISISNAKRIAPIVTVENKTEWIEKATVLPQRKLEQELAKNLPKEAVQEKVKFVSEHRVKLEMGLDEETLALFRKAQDLCSQKSKSAESLESTLKSVLKEFIEKHDPVERAKRIAKRQTVKRLPVSRRGAARQAPSKARIAIPARIVHQVNLRDHRQCQAPLPNGEKCNSTRWLDYHHKTPVKFGGENTIENLITLCSQHHRQQHV